MGRGDKGFTLFQEFGDFGGVYQVDDPEWVGV